MSAIAERYRAVRERVGDAADAAGRDPRDVTIVAVSKTVGPAEIESAVAAGVRDFGENRAQEFYAKQSLFPDARWHFVGTLQSRKAKWVVGKAELIHSVDRVKLLRVVDELAAEQDIVQRVLLQVNVSGEESKHGFPAEAVEDVLREAERFPHVSIEGLMTMAPLGPPEAARPVFSGLADLFASLDGMRFTGVEMHELSMGMTNDFTVAVEEGSTMVRVGRAVFGNGHPGR